ncbi:hypothetical protein FKP32DRAFT_1673259 [Trametes sanguinea]|nr:hypothetical protein FKP32DRAFT_1673259 [Trametes sanguinea]
MAKPQRQQKQKSKSTTNARQAVARQIHATKKRSKAQARISKSQIADVTDQINGEFAQVQNFYVRTQQAEPVHAPSLPEPSVHDLADIMKGL